MDNDQKNQDASLTGAMPRVLVIDDDPFITDMYVLKFKDERFDVITARDGQDGLKKIKEFRPDVVVLDLVMPNKDGFEVLETLRNESGPRPKILLLSNLGQKEDVERGMDLGASDYVVKAHFTPSEVVERVRALLQK